jgi:inner membrane transporter RhtA
MPAFDRSSILYSVALLLVAMLSMHIGAVLAKQLFPLVGAPGLTAMRLGFGSLILLAYFRPWRSSLRGRAWRPLIIYGVVMGTMNSTFYLSLERIPLGIAVALEFTGPLALAVLGSRRLLDFFWVVLAVAGLLLLMPWTESQAPLDMVGVALALVAGVCWALYIIYGQKAGAAHGPQAVALGSVIASLFVVPIGISDAGSALFSSQVLLIGLCVAVLSMAIPFTLEMLALGRLSTPTFGMLMSLEPAVGALCGLMFLHEKLSVLQWLAIAAIVIASAGAARAAKGRAVPAVD